TSAPEVNKTPLLLRELTMKALNAAQSKGTTASFPSLDTPIPFPTLASISSVQPVAGPNVSFDPISATPPVQAQDQNFDPPADSAVPATLEPGHAEPSPAPASSQPANRSTEKATEGSQEKTILFIEDDQFALKVYGKGLRRAGFNVEVAEDGM